MKTTPNKYKLLFLLGVVGWLIALYLKVNVPEMSEPASVYVDIISFALICFLIIIFVFKGRFRL